MARMGVSLSKEKREELFKAIDKDGSGSLDIDELSAFLKDTAVESEAGGMASAVRAGMTAMYYGAVTRKAMHAAKDAEGSRNHVFSVDLDVNKGCSMGEARTAVELAVDSDTSALPESVKTGTIELHVWVKPDADAKAVAEAIVNAPKEDGDLAEMYGEGGSLEADVGDEGKWIVIRINAPAKIDEMFEDLPIPMPVIAHGLGISVGATLPHSLMDILTGAIKPMDVSAHLKVAVNTSTTSLAFLGSAVEMFGMVSDWSAIAPTRITYSGGVDLRKFFEEPVIKDRTIAKKYKSFCEGAKSAVEDEDDMPKGIKMLLGAFAGLKAVYVNTGTISLRLVAKNGRFPIITDGAGGNPAGDDHDELKLMRSSSNG